VPLLLFIQIHPIQGIGLFSNLNDVLVIPFSFHNYLLFY